MRLIHLPGVSLELICSTLCAGVLSFSAAGCSGSEDRGNVAESPTPGYDGWSPTATPATTPPPLPDENEDAFYRTAPAATDRYVFVVNPDRDTLSKINASTRAVYTLEVGVHPTQVLVGPLNSDKAAVLNAGDSTLSIIDTRADTSQSVPIHPDTNFMALSPDGAYAITWYDARVEGASSDVNGVRSYSSISVVYTGSSTQAPTSTPIATAMNPRAASFLPGGLEALVLCDNALAQITLSSKPSSRLIPLTQDVDEKLSVAEMKVSPDGRYAFLRLTTTAALMVVDLDAADPADAVSRIPLAVAPTDMDIAASSLILVDRTNRLIQIFDALDPSSAPRSIGTPENQIVGSVAVAPDLERAILYTTLTEKDIQGTSYQDIPLNRISVWDLSDDRITLHVLVKAVASVSVNQTAAADVATIIHQGDAHSDYAAFDQQEALSHFYFSDGLAVASVLEQPIKALADAPGGAYEFVILEDSLNTIVVDYVSRQLATVPVQSQPAFVGILTGSSTGYVSQEHDLGRISFIDPRTGTSTTITGFELNSQP